MKRRMSRVTALVFLLAAMVCTRVSAAFSSLWAFGDGVCTTTDAPTASYFYGNRYCNGRVWIEVLAQWQGLAYVPARNNSYFGHDSNALLSNISAFTAPPDVATALFVVWCANADFVEFTQVNTPPYNSSDDAAWTNFINQSVSRHTQAVNNLYAKGVRTLIMPNAADITGTPYYAFFAQANKTYIRHRAIQFNIAFNTALDGLVATKPGLAIHRPDTFAFFEDVLANAASYGLVNTGIDAITDGKTNFTGPGASYIFWDYSHPTARFQMHLAALVQQMISPVNVDGLIMSGGSGQLTIANIPLGRQGIVEGSATLQPPWARDLLFTRPAAIGGSTTAPVTVPASAAKRFYRVSFPVVWSFP